MITVAGKSESDSIIARLENDSSRDHDLDRFLAPRGEKFSQFQKEFHLQRF